MSADGKALEAGHTRLTLLTCVMDHILSLTPDQGSGSEIHTVVLCFNTFGIEFAAGLLQNLLAMNANYVLKLGVGIRRSSSEMTCKTVGLTDVTSFERPSPWSSEQAPVSYDSPYCSQTPSRFGKARAEQAKNRYGSSSGTKEQHESHKFCTWVSAVAINQLETIISVPVLFMKRVPKDHVLYMAEMTYRLNEFSYIVQSFAADEINPVVCFMEGPLSACSGFRYLLACGISAKFLLLRSYPSHNNKRRLRQASIHVSKFSKNFSANTCVPAGPK